MALFIDKFNRICSSRKLSLLISLNVGIFVVLWLTLLIGNAAGLTGNFTLKWLCISSNFTHFCFTPWTAITYMVVQYDFFHLLFNMLWLFWFGKILLTTLSGRHLLFLYVGGGLTGALFYIALTLLFPFVVFPSGWLCGASASVLAIIVASAIRTPDLRLSLFLFGTVKLKWIALACVVLTFLGIGGGNQGGQAAHVGGMLFGLAFCFSLKKNVDPTRFLNHLKPSLKFKERTVFAAEKSSRSEEKRNLNGEALAEKMHSILSDTGRLDFLLDKIRVSGYDSLSVAERRELNILSQSIGNKKGD